MRSRDDYAFLFTHLCNRVVRGAMKSISNLSKVNRSLTRRKKGKRKNSCQIIGAMSN